jgi:hypothetical protein
MKLKEAMDVQVQRFDTLTRSLTAATPRRGLLAGLTGGLLAARSQAIAVNDAEAKKKGKRRKKSKNKNKKDRTETRVDATCPGPADNAGLGLLDGESLAQTLTALKSGRLIRAELLILAGETGSADLTLQLRDINASGVPTDDVLAETTVLTADVPSGGESTVVFAFAVPPAVAANREYALVLSSRGSRADVWRGRRGDGCDGRAFRRNSGSEVFESPSPSDLDLVFTTVVEF